MKIFNKIVNNQYNKTSYFFLKKTKKHYYLLKFLWKNNLILGFYKKRYYFQIFLKYFKNQTIFNSFIKIKIYLSLKQLWQLNDNNKLVYIFYTCYGFKTLFECKEQNLCGKLILILT